MFYQVGPANPYLLPTHKFVVKRPIFVLPMIVFNLRVPLPCFFRAVQFRFRADGKVQCSTSFPSSLTKIVLPSELYYLSSVPVKDLCLQ